LGLPELLASKQECQNDWHPSKDFQIDWYPYGSYRIDWLPNRNAKKNSIQVRLQINWYSFKIIEVINFQIRMPK
jgi:hypothetical protein